MSEPHGWTLAEESRIVHSGPLHLIRVLYHCEDDKDELILYDGLSVTAREIANIQGNEEVCLPVEIGIRLTNGLYVALEENCHVTVVFDPLGDE